MHEMPVQPVKPVEGRLVVAEPDRGVNAIGSGASLQPGGATPHRARRVCAGRSGDAQEEGDQQPEKRQAAELDRHRPAPRAAFKRLGGPRPRVKGERQHG